MPRYPSDLNRPVALLAASPLWDEVDGGTLVVACSGGADSTALALAARELLADPDFASRFRRPPDLVLWHLDHGLRPDSAADAQFVRILADELQAQAVIETADLTAQLAAEGGNMEALAREERYARLLRFTQQYERGQAVTAHHLDDQAETILHHVIRGTHLAGLRGIAPLTQGVIHRPWLSLRRSEIEAFLADRGQHYVTDPSNADTTLTRNRLRHHVLPLLAELNPRALEHIAQLANVAREAAELRRGRLAQLEVRVIDATELARWLPVLGWPAGYEAHYLRDGWPPGQLAAYAATVLGRAAALSSVDHDELDDWAADPWLPLSLRGRTLELVHAELLSISTDVDPDEPAAVRLESGASVQVGALKVSVVASPEREWQLFRRRARHVWETICNWPQTLAELCASPPEGGTWECFLPEVRLPLTLRTWRVGERIQRSSGSATLGDVFTNAKLPLPLRRTWAVLADADDQVLWVPGIADGASMQIPADTTPELLVRIQQTA